VHIPYFQTKALAEKNMRDLLAQREQAEKHVRHLHTENSLTVSAFIHSIGVYVFQRLSEFLDPEIKRWSNGKEGNLRALLSTLQYVSS